jgi:AcrR family transcriptional regulator
MDAARSTKHRTLPRGINALPKKVVEREQHKRLTEAMVHVVAEQGYAATAVADVLKAAGISRRTFYELFADKEDCFLAAYDDGVETLSDAIAEGYDRRGPWPERLRYGLEAALDYLSTNPETASTLLVEVLAAGPRALKRRERLLRALHRLVADAPEQDEARGALLTEAVVGSLYELAYARVLRGKAKRLRDMERDFLYVALVPFLGHEATIAEMDEAFDD